MDAAAQAFAEGFGAILEIIPTDGPPFHIDGRGTTALVCAGPSVAPAQCAWSAPLDDLRRIFEGGRALESAYLSGRLKIGGDMSVMARLKLQSRR
jgi:hypothetical protein